jgi:UDPglucose 6-dehydrogenase
MNVGIIGHGFVGLACETGFQQVADIRVYDKFKDTESLESVVENCSLIFLCLPTPMNEDGSCNLEILYRSVHDIAGLAKNRKTLVVKSTVPPQTTQDLSDYFGRHSFLFNPEFLTEKNFINDFLTQDRIILGKTKSCSSDDFLKVRKFYEKFTTTQETPAEIIECDSTTAEMVKYTTNCFLATKTTFFNEIYDVCQEIKVDYETLTSVLLQDKRIGRSHYKVPGNHGRGFSGSCFPKDLNALIAFMNENDIDSTLLQSVWTKNLLLRDFDTGCDHLPQVTGKYEKNE